MHVVATEAPAGDARSLRGSGAEIICFDYEGESMNAQWLVKLFYPLPLPQVYVATSVKNWPAGATTKTLTVECYLQSVLSSTMSNIIGYLNPNYNTFLTERSEIAIVNDFIETAANRIQWYPGTGFQVDPVEMGTEYGQLQVALMKQIDSGDGKTSLWDTWVAMTSPVH